MIKLTASQSYSIECADIEGDVRKFHIEANSSTVVVGCSGDTVIQGGTPTDELEAELLRVFRRLTVRDRVEVMRIVYEFDDRAKRPGK